jgi:hypothetical protein
MELIGTDTHLGAVFNLGDSISVEHAFKKKKALVLLKEGPLVPYLLPPCWDPCCLRGDLNS